MKSVAPSKLRRKLLYKVTEKVAKREEFLLQIKYKRDMKCRERNKRRYTRNTFL